MADSDMTPFDALRATFHMDPDDTKITVSSPDDISVILLKLERVGEPHDETLTLKMIDPHARKVPRIDIPVITQTELNGTVWVKTNVAGYPIEAHTLSELGFKIGLLSSVNGFTTASLTLMRQAGGDSEFTGYFRRV